MFKREFGHNLRTFVEPTFGRFNFAKFQKNVATYKNREEALKTFSPLQIKILKKVIKIYN